MPIYDVSVPLSNDMPTWPGDPAIEISAWKGLAKGDSSNVYLLHLGAHTGTHVDAPAHFIAGGNKLESLPLDVLIGRAVVAEVPIVQSYRYMVFNGRVLLIDPVTSTVVADVTGY